MKNIELSRIFEQIARILKIKGENPFKIRAYEKITLVLENLPIDIETIYHQGGLKDIPGVGSAIAKKIEEFLTTGKLEYYEKLKETTWVQVVNATLNFGIICQKKGVAYDPLLSVKY